MAQNPNPSSLDQGQIIQRVFDKDNDSLRVDANVQIDTIDANLTIDIKAESGDNISITNADGTNPLVINPDGSINVAPISISLPTGAATSANQTSELAKLDILHADLVTIEGKQDIGNTSLSNIDSKLIDFNTDPIQTIQLFTLPYDSITATYPSTTQEVFKSRVGGISGTIQQTVTINYTDTTKNFIMNIART